MHARQLDAFLDDAPALSGDRRRHADRRHGSPRLKVPKYLATSAFVASLSKSPTIREAPLFGT